MNKAEIRHKAFEILEKRRQNAQAEAKLREDEITRKYPEIAEYRAALAMTNIKLTRCIIQKGPDYKKNFEKIKNGHMECTRMIKEILRRGGYPEDYLDVHYRCPICNDEGYTDKGLCECLKRTCGKIAADELNKEANLPQADFEHFDLSLYKGGFTNGIPNEEIMRTSFELIRNYANNFSTDSGNMLFIGNPGLGKTHLAMAVAKEVARKGFTVIYGSAINQLRKIENEHFGTQHSDASLDYMLDCELLIIDDLGSEIPSSFYESVLYTIINTRINTSLPTLVTTNLTADEMKTRYNARIVSRLSYNFYMVPFKGQDIREKKVF